MVFFLSKANPSLVQLGKITPYQLARAHCSPLKLLNLGAQDTHKSSFAFLTHQTNRLVNGCFFFEDPMNKKVLLPFLTCKTRPNVSHEGKPMLS